MIKMNRVALAVLAVLGSTTVMAQSSVTIYGRINTTIERQKIGDESVSKMENNSSRWGMRGVEDLGGGLKAGFVLESGFASDTGMGSSSTGALTFGRQSEVNLSGNFGMLRLGNFFPGSYFATADYVSMHNHDTGSSSDALYFDPVWFASGLGTANKISYTTPNFGGLTVEGSVSMHEKATALAKKKNGYDLAANYNVGPWPWAPATASSTKTSSWPSALPTLSASSCWAATTSATTKKSAARATTSVCRACTPWALPSST